MNNLYIVNTPLHMLTAYILANSVTAENKNHLLLLTPKGYPAWGKSKCLEKMSNDPEVWSNITVIDKRYIKQDIKDKGIKSLFKEYQKKILSCGPIDQVYLASDKILYNQLMVELTGNTKYIRFDEGSASYFIVDRKKTTKIAEVLQLKLLRHLLGLKSDMEYNFSGIGAGKAGTADYLYRLALLQRYSPNAMAIEKSFIACALRRLDSVTGEYDELKNENVVIYLGNKLCEHKLISPEQEINLLQKIKNMATNRNMKFLYKPHPAEHKDKLERYSREIPGMQIFNTYEPMEIILHKYTTIKFLISFASSAMIYANIFSQDKDFELISLLCLMGLDKSYLSKYAVLKMNLEKSGVKMPTTMDELQEAFDF